MGKISFKYSLKNDDNLITHEGEGQYSNKVLEFMDKDETKVVLDFINNKIIRDNKEITLEIDFFSRKGNIFIKELDKSIDLSIYINNVLVKENNFIIKYKIEDSLFEFSILWKDLGD